ncbi:hypothetical protein Rhal01_01386 [Rubritalea halochordaticola]|uniref:Sulfotransferase family protein n=1 Tax=Rubritalea halochordaticola TaxID=714537 RepID=A0ABP9UXM6_9BACT
MISHDYKCIFLHIPKCAGTSIESVLGHHEGYRGPNRQDHRTLRSIQQPIFSKDLFKNLENFTELGRRFKRKVISRNENPRNKLMVTKEQYRQYYKFTIVRNPWARAFSWYKAVQEDPVFRNFVNLEADVNFYEALNKCIGKDLLREQTYWITDYTGAIPLDFIAKLETLESDFPAICNDMGVEGLSLPHHLKRSGSYLDAFDDKTKDLVYHFYKEEIRLFGYEFEI